ncbi:hypothetical protein NECAME_11214 [Necator americanus]|uniref:TATA element modulatory factor 1 TATA binding domain-containing protein n=1 Tax=Necator americanus TaxID=51031 RepID=W2T7S3_NECAM|nr:hypothetical protein NECAME_11214 [Necator americanus]ETN77216.1 hypothetical protein NECAME_11214 [Necator americanus]
MFLRTVGSRGVGGVVNFSGVIHGIQWVASPLLDQSDDVVLKLPGLHNQISDALFRCQRTQVYLKKELDGKKAELEDLLIEGKRLSDHSGKQAREIRRLRSELVELEKVKAERKRLKDEKLRAEETIELQKEEISSLKCMIKQFESSVEQMVKEQSQRATTTEASSRFKNVAQKHVLEQSKLVADLERQIDEARRQINHLTDFNKKLTKETEMMQSANWSQRLAGERAIETAATVNAELQEARAHIERLNSQLRSTENVGHTLYRLDVVLNERNNVAESFSQANMPLIEEINGLKQALHREQRASEEADVKFRANKKELDIVREELRKLREKNDSLVTHHLQELTIVNQKVQHLERELAGVLKNNESLLSELRSARVADARSLDELREENSVLTNECKTVRSSLKELMDENESLKSSLAEARQQAVCANSVETSSRNQPLMHVNNSENDSFKEFPLNNSQIALFSFAALPNVHEMSLRKTSFLEQEAIRCVQLEEQVRQLEKTLQVLTTQYDDLLEVDGERLERIEELEHDVTDLRQLMKEQVEFLKVIIAKFLPCAVGVNLLSSIYTIFHI